MKNKYWFIVLTILIMFGCTYSAGEYIAFEESSLFLRENLIEKVIEEPDTTKTLVQKNSKEIPPDGKDSSNLSKKDQKIKKDVSNATRQYYIDKKLDILEEQNILLDSLIELKKKKK